MFATSGQKHKLSTHRCVNFLASYRFIHLRSKCSPQHPHLTPVIWEPKFSYKHRTMTKVTYTLISYVRSIPVAARSAAARLTETAGSNPARCMDVCLLCCVLLGRGLCDELITHPEESYRLWCVCVWSTNLKNVEANARVAPYHHRGTKKCVCLCTYIKGKGKGSPYNRPRRPRGWVEV